MPFYVKRLARCFSPRVNVLIAGGIAVVALFGVSQLRGLGGVAAVFTVMASLIHLGFLLSRYINRDAPSEKRASILSVKNLSLNLGYGLFSGLVAIRLNHTSFGNTLQLLPLILLASVLLWFALSRNIRAFYTEPPK